MDINHINLPGFLVAELYGNSLVLSENETRKVPPETGWKSLGQNQKNILVIVKNPEQTHLPDDELKFLTGILTACKLSLADIAILNLSNYPGAGYKELTSHFKSKVILLFDVSPVEFGLPMKFPHYQIQPFAANSFLYSPSLKSLESDKLEKSKLWVSLKRLFNL